MVKTDCKRSPFLSVNSTEKIKKATSGFAFFMKHESKERKKFYLLGDQSLKFGVYMGKEYRKLSPSALKVYEDLAAESMSEYKAKKSEEIVHDSEIFRTRAGINVLKKINLKLSVEQRAVVEAVGFGPIMGVVLGNLRHDIVKWMVKSYVPEKGHFKLHGHVISFDAAVVEQLLGLRNEGSAVPVDGDEDESYKSLVSFYGKYEVIPYTVLGRKLAQSGSEGDAKFAQTYILSVISHFLCPSTDNGVNQMYLHAVKNVRLIPTYNWAAFVYDQLLTGIIQYQKRKYIYLTGCVHILMMLFLDHVNILKNVKRDHRVRPSSHYWTSDKMAAKIKKLGNTYLSSFNCRIIDNGSPFVASEDIKKIVNEIDERDNFIEEHLLKIRGPSSTLTKEDLVSKVPDERDSKESRQDDYTITLSDDDERANSPIVPAVYENVVLLQNDETLFLHLVHGSDSEYLVQNNSGYINRGQMKELLTECSFIGDEVINSVAYILNFEESTKHQDSWWCETHVWQHAQAQTDKSDTLISNYWKTHSFKGNIGLVGQIYLPWNIRKHWGLVIIDMILENIIVCDTLNDYVPETIFLEQLQNTLEYLYVWLKDWSGNNLVADFRKYVKIRPIWVPQQAPEGNDCGVYVCSMMRFRNLGDEWMQVDSVRYREELAFYLWRHATNVKNGISDDI